jgi:hypothetical protein
MTALSADFDLAVTGGDYRRLPSEAAANPYNGSLLSYAADGYVHELVAGEPFAGVCRVPIDTSDAATADGSRYIEAVGGQFYATVTLTATVANIGQRVFATDDATFTLTQASASTFVGRVVGIESATKAIILMQTQELVQIDSFAMIAAGAALTNSTTRTAWATYTIKAGSLRVGSRIRVRGQVIATATNSTDTLLVDIGGAVGATPAIIVGTAATDVANDNVAMIDADIVVRTLGATGTLAGSAWLTTAIAANLTAAPVLAKIVSTTVNTTADIVLGLYGTWSVASASNSARADLFTVDVIR